MLLFTGSAGVKVQICIYMLSRQPGPETRHCGEVFKLLLISVPTPLPPWGVPRTQQCMGPAQGSPSQGSVWGGWQVFDLNVLKLLLHSVFW